MFSCFGWISFVNNKRLVPESRKRTYLGAEGGVLQGCWTEVGGGTCHWGTAAVGVGGETNAKGWDWGGVAGTVAFSSTVLSSFVMVYINIHKI